MINKVTFTAIINNRLKWGKRYGGFRALTMSVMNVRSSRVWPYRWEPLYFSRSGYRLVKYLPSFLTCSLEVLLASINLFKVSPRLKIFLSIICNLFSVILFSWGVHWVSETDDVRDSLTLLTDTLEILVKGGIEGDTTVNFPISVSDITVMYYYQQNNISKQN